MQSYYFTMTVGAWQGWGADGLRPRIGAVRRFHYDSPRRAPAALAIVGVAAVYYVFERTPTASDP